MGDRLTSLLERRECIWVFLKHHVGLSDHVSILNVCWGETRLLGFNHPSVDLLLG